MKIHLDKESVKIQTQFRNNLKQKIITPLGQYTVQRVSDKRYWDGAVWQLTPTQILMLRVSDANSPGLWELIFITLNFSPDEYLFEITDSSATAANVPQTASVPVGTKASQAIEAGAILSVGRVSYDEVTSVMTLWEWDDPNTIAFKFNMKDSAGNPAVLNDFFQKIPQ